MKRIRSVKPEIRLIGIDDGSPKRVSKFPVVGAVLRGGLWLDGVVGIEIDLKAGGVVEAIAQMILSSRFYKELRVIMLHGRFISNIAPGGLMRLHEICGLPVMAFFETDAWKRCIEPSEGDAPLLSIKQGGFHILCLSLTKENAEAILKVSWKSSDLPEPLRVARLLASALKPVKS